jgi:YD repeat-containing protein
MTDRDRWGVRGPVKRIEAQRIWYAPLCGTDQCAAAERGDLNVVEFRRNGALVEHTGRNPDGSEHSARYEYDSADRLVAVTFTSTTGSPMVRRHEYDETGRLLRIVERGQDGHDHVAETHAYGAMGVRTKTTAINPATDRAGFMSWAVDGTDVSYSAPGATALTTIYDARSLVTEALLLDAGGGTLGRVEFRYDDAGHLVEETFSRDDPLAGMADAMNPAEANALRALLGGEGGVSRRLYTYDANGRRIGTVSSLCGPLGRERRTMAYNQRGDQVEDISESDERHMNIDDDGHLIDDPTGATTSRSEARIDYEYDERGNWIRKTVLARNALDRDFIASSVEQRAIAYYD